MKNKVSMIIRKLEFGKSEVTFICQGDVWEWFNKKQKKNTNLAYNCNNIRWFDPLILLKNPIK